MDEQQLLRILKQDEAAATSYHESELAKAQEEALKRYFAEPYGDEAEGRSKVVTHDLEDTINWLMPDLMRAFTASDDLVSCVARNPQDEQQMPLQSGQTRTKADIMASYLSHVFFEDNDGPTVVHDFAFDGLLQRMGVVHVGWEDPQRGPPQLVEGVGVAQLQRYLEDPEYEITGADEDGDTFVLEVRRTPRIGRVVVEAVPPEEFAIDKSARSVKDARYHRRKQVAYKAELIRTYPDKKDELAEVRSAIVDSPASSDSRYQARFSGESVDESTDRTLDQGREQVWLITEYIRIDFDGDGTVELRQIKRVGDIILENEEVGHSEYVTWTPSRVSHKVVGRSIHDQIKSIQKIRTVITRSYLDGLSQTVTPRTYVNTQSVDDDGLDTILNNEYGGVVRTKGDPNAAVRETATPDVSGPCLSALEYFEQKGAESSGVTKHSQGMDPAALNKTATGIDLLQAAAKTRIELIARWLGDALEDVFGLILKKVVHHQDGARLVKLFGEWVEVDPRTWSDEISVKIDVGSAGVSKQQRIAHLMMLAQKQEQVLLQAGPGNPLVTLQHYRATLAALTSDMGFPDPSLFWGEIPQNWQPPPQSDPKAEEAKARLQLDAQKAQADQQMQAAKLQGEAELARIKAQSEREIAEIRLASETQIALERMAMEMQLAREKAEMEAELAERDSMRRASVAEKTAKAKFNGGGVRFGGEVG